MAQFYGVTNQKTEQGCNRLQNTKEPKGNFNYQRNQE